MIDKLKKLPTAATRIKELESLVEKQARMIESLRACKSVRLPAGTKGRKNEKSGVRVVVGDTHGAHIDKAAAGAFFCDLEVLQPQSVIHLGDALDCGGFLATHHTLGVVAECDITWEQDVTEANWFLDEVQRRCPQAAIEIISGNHDDRVEKTVIKWVLQNAANARYLLSMFGPESVLNVQKRGIRWHKSSEFHDGLSIRGTIKRDRNLYRHGTRYGAYAANYTLTDMGANVNFGHTHRMAMVLKEVVDGVIAAYSFGGLMVRRPLWGLTNITGWTHGYGIQWHTKNGFLTLPVPIIDGVSFLFPMLNALNIK